MNDAPSPTPPQYTEAGTRLAQREVASLHPDTSKICLLVLASLAVLATLYVAASIILPLLLAMVLTLLLAPVKRLLVERLRLPAALASLLLIMALFAAVGGMAFALTLPAADWMGKLPQAEATLRHKLGFVGAGLDYVRHGLDQIGGMLDGHPATQGAALPPQPAAAAAPASSGANLGGIGLTVLRGTRDALGQLLTLVVTLFFTLAYGDTLLRRLVEVMPTSGDRKRLVEIASEIERNISAYLLTITVMNLFTGTANFVSMWLQGLPDPLLWGTLAFLLNYIPILGPITGMVIFLLVGLFVKSSLWGAVLPPAIYLAVHVLEGESLTPMLLARRFTLNPVLVIVSLFFWDWMWGVVGAFLAVPLLAITKIVCDNIPALTPLGHLLGSPKRHTLQA
jgi:predicted PurR-regulated permease PerM